MIGNLQQAIDFLDLVGINNTWPDLDMIPFGNVGCDYFGTHCNGGHAKIEEVEFFMTVYMMARYIIFFSLRNYIMKILSIQKKLRSEIYNP